MMVETHNNLGDVSRAPVTRVVVYDDFNNPVAVIMSMQKGRITVVRVGDKNFNEALRMLGVRQTVVVETIEADRLPRLSLR